MPVPAVNFPFSHDLVAYLIGTAGGNFYGCHVVAYFLFCPARRYSNRRLMKSTNSGGSGPAFIPCNQHYASALCRGFPLFRARGRGNMDQLSAVVQFIQECNGPVLHAMYAHNVGDRVDLSTTAAGSSLNVSASPGFTLRRLLILSPISKGHVALNAASFIVLPPFLRGN